jgi:hypothetical protein
MRIATKLITWMILLANIPFAALPLGRPVADVSIHTAAPLANASIPGHRADEINAAFERRWIKLATDVSNCTRSIHALLTAATPAGQTTASGQTFSWSDVIICNHAFAVGDELITLYQRVNGNGFMFGDGMFEDSDRHSISPGRLNSSKSLGTSSVTIDGGRVSDGTPFRDLSLTPGDGFRFPGIMVGDGIMVRDGIMVGDTLQSAVTGEETAFTR